MMTKTVAMILLSELSTIRIICQNEGCGAVLESDLSRVLHLLGDGACPCCHTSFRVRGQGGEYPLAQLVRAVSALADMQKLAVEFVMPVKQERGA
jgi:hypothetical protein